MDNQFRDLTTSWTQLGETDVYWSVLTRDPFRAKNITKENHLTEFFDIGKKDFAYLEALIQKYGFTFSGKTVLEFGCGVGRLLLPCSEVAKEVIGIDISKPHLDLAKKTIPQGTFYLLDSYHALPVLSEKPDIIYSIIVLQHNRPPLMKQYIRLLLHTLSDNGLAILHAPYHIDNYTFDNERYKGRIAMEMHCVARKEVKQIIQECGCVLLGMDDLDRCGGNILNTTYIIHKQVKQ